MNGIGGGYPEVPEPLVEENESQYLLRFTQSKEVKRVISKRSSHVSFTYNNF